MKPALIREGPSESPMLSRGRIGAYAIGHRELRHHFSEWGPKPEPWPQALLAGGAALLALAAWVLAFALWVA